MNASVKVQSVPFSPAGALRLSRITGAALLALLIVGPAAFAAEDQAGQQPKRPRSEAVAPSQVAATTAFTIGDRLRITFFEKYGDEAAPVDRATLSALVERSEMTGEYVVQQDGHIFLPLIGPVMTANLTTVQLQDTLTKHFAALFEGDVAVAIQLIEREPIYVAGAIAQPGHFPYVPGMTAMHALALAGASDKIAGDQWRQLDLMRERERVSQSDARVKGLLARAMVLTAERNSDNDALSQQLEAVAGPLVAGQLVAEAQGLRDLERDRFLSRHRASETILASLDRERGLVAEGIADAETAMREKAERVDVMNVLRRRGATTDQNVHLARSELSNARATWNELRASQARIERNISEVRLQDRDREIEEQIAVERELQSLRASVALEDATRTTMAQVLVRFAAVETAGLEDPSSQVRLEIVRRTPGGLKHIPAHSFTEMLPGDLLNIMHRDATHQTAEM